MPYIEHDKFFWDRRELENMRINGMFGDDQYMAALRMQEQMWIRQRDVLSRMQQSAVQDLMKCPYGPAPNQFPPDDLLTAAWKSPNPMEGIYDPKERARKLVLLLC